MMPTPATCWLTSSCRSRAIRARSASCAWIRRPARSLVLLVRSPELGLALDQRLLHLLALGDVEGRADVAGEDRRRDRSAARRCRRPSGRCRRPAGSGIPSGTAGGRRTPAGRCATQRSEIVGVDAMQPAVADQLIHPQSGELEHGGVEEVGRHVRRRRPHHHRGAVGHQAEARFALPQRPLGAGAVAALHQQGGDQPALEQQQRRGRHDVALVAVPDAGLTEEHDAAGRQAPPRGCPSAAARASRRSGGRVPSAGS